MEWWHKMACDLDLLSCLKGVRGPRAGQHLRHHGGGQCAAAAGSGGAGGGRPAGTAAAAERQSAGDLPRDGVQLAGGEDSRRQTRAAR